MGKNRYTSPYDYEQKTAEKIDGAKRSIASGAFFGDMDVQGPYCLIDCKRVEKGNYYKVDRRDFNKVADKANADQIPCMFINFNQHGQSLAVMKEEDAIALINMIKDYEELQYMIKSLEK